MLNSEHSHGPNNLVARAWGHAGDSWETEGISELSGAYGTWPHRPFGRCLAMSRKEISPHFVCGTCARGAGWWVIGAERASGSNPEPQSAFGVRVRGCMPAGVSPQAAGGTSAHRAHCANDGEHDGRNNWGVGQTGACQTDYVSSPGAP